MYRRTKNCMNGKGRGEKTRRNGTAFPCVTLAYCDLWIAGGGWQYHTAAMNGKRAQSDILFNNTEVLQLLSADVRKTVNGKLSKINQYFQSQNQHLLA